MTLAAPRSRQGKLTLVLAIIAALAAVAGGLLWYNSASASLPTTVNALNFTASSPQAHGATGVLLYDTHWTTSAPVTAVNETVLLEITGIDTANLGPLTAANVTCVNVAGGANITWVPTYAAGTATCTGTPTAAQAAAAGTFSIHLTVTILQGSDNVVGAATTRICSDAVATGGCSNEGANIVSATTAAVNVTAVTPASITPPAATNLIGQPEVFTISFPIGVTCGSDNFVANGAAGNDATRDCAAGDLVITGTAAGTATVTGWPPADTALNTATSVPVTVSNTAAGTVILTLANRYEGTPGETTGIEDVGDDVALAAAVATKTFQTLAQAGGVIRHVDVDCASERASDAGDNHTSAGLPPTAGGDYGSNVLACNGLLSNGNIFTGVNAVSGYALDDDDDATGSAHTVCILSGALTSADNANISWSVTPTAAHQDPVDVNTNKFGLDVSGNANLEPCASWRVGDVGVEQAVTAIWLPTGETIYSNGVRSSVADSTFGLCPNDTSTTPDTYGDCEPLIKQWNSIVSTTIVQATGAVGDTLADNNLQLDDWTARDGNDCVAPGSFCAGLNQDGATLTQEGTVFQEGAGQDMLRISGRSFVDYTLGSHDNYNGPVDGAVQTFTATGECGTVQVENPSTGVADLLTPNTVNNDVTLPTNSDKGVGFTIAPTDNGTFTSTTDTADCFDGECTTVTIATIEATSLSSRPLFEPADETVTVCWQAGPNPEKQPMLAWVGQRVVLSRDWSDPDGTCPWYGPEGEPFFVRYLIQTPSPGALSNVPNDAPAVVTGPDYIIVQVDGNDCISHVIYESQNQGRVDVTAHVVAEPTQQPAADYSVISPEYDFWYYYMKIEDVTLKIVPGARSGHNEGAFAPQNPSAASDVASVTSNVSADVLLRVTVRGWVLADNCPVANNEEADINGLLLPDNRCIFPTDWATVVGDDEQFDILGAAPSSCSNVAGPFSLLQEVRVNGSSALVNCGDTTAPHVGGGFRESVFSNGSVGTEDAPFPPALITLDLEGSGFLYGAAKGAVYSATNEYFATHIPAEPQILVAGSGYQWHTWTGTGAKSGLYNFWTSLAGSGTPIVSCPGDSPCSDGVATGGYDMIQIYSDNHGEAMAWVNGDANLTFDDCDNNLSSHAIVLLSGHYCELNDIVGTTTVTANADYPDKKPHQDVDADDPVTITWTWGGTKDISVVDDAADSTGQFNYVVFRVTDRDGGCTSNNSLHPVLGETVQFLIDSPTGVIFDDVNGNNAEFGPGVPNGSKSATVTTFDANNYYALDDLTQPADLRISFAPTTDECEAWIHVSESQLANVNVVVTAFDPEGTVTFDTTDINPTPAPTPVPTEEPPFTIATKWGNTDCSQDGVTSRDAQAVLKRVGEKTELSQDQPCPSIGQLVIVDGNNQRWGNWDCDTGGVTSRDAQAVLKFVGQKTALSQTSPCPLVGADVVVQPISIP